MLTFTDRKLLEVGVQESTLEAIEDAFARFQGTDRRVKLFAKLRSYLEEVKAADCGTSAIIDGSFVMGCVDAPNDIDLILILPNDWDWSMELQPYRYNLISKRRVKAEFGLDVFPVKPGSIEERKWIEFFCQVNIKWCQNFGWPSDSRKGIVRVAI